MGRAAAGRTAQCTATLTVAALQTAHAALTQRGRWVTNEKRLLDYAGLRELDRVIARTSSDSATLEAVCDEVDALCEPIWAASQAGQAPAI